MDQELGGDAAFVVLSCADIRRIDDRGYRAAQLRAGLVEGRLHLAAYALGAGASGMTFYDSRSPAFVGEPLAACSSRASASPSTRTAPAACPGRPSSIVYPAHRTSERVNPGARTDRRSLT